MWGNRRRSTSWSQVLEILGEDADVATRPLTSGRFQLHARYTRDEALLALGDGSFEKPPTSREGVRWLSDITTDVLFVTLRKSERHYSPSTRYRDFALSSRLFHWESQSTTSADSPTGRRYAAATRTGPTSCSSCGRARRSRTVPGLRSRCSGRRASWRLAASARFRSPGGSTRRCRSRCSRLRGSSPPERPTPPPPPPPPPSPPTPSPASSHPPPQAGSPPRRRDAAHRAARTSA